MSGIHVFDQTCKHQDSVYFITSDRFFGLELLKKYDQKEEMDFEDGTLKYRKIVLKTFKKWELVTEIKDRLFASNLS